MEAEAKTQAVAALVRTLPEGRLRALQAALLAGVHAPGGGGDLAPVLDAAAAELAGRGTATIALAPLAPLFAAPAHALAGPSFTGDAARAWLRDAERYEPTRLAEATAEALRWREDEPAPEVCDVLCAALARRVLAGEGALAALAADDCGSLGEALALAGVVRRATPHLAGWTERPTPEQAAQARLAMRDAGEIGDDGGLMLVRVLASHLSDPWKVLALVSTLTERASDRYLSESELAPFGETLLDAMEADVAAVGRFAGYGGAEAGTAAAEAVNRACAGAAAFEARLDLGTKGPWGKRVAAAKRTLAGAVELRLRDLDPAVDGAFPLQAARLTKRVTTAEPRLTAEPDAARVARAETLAAFAAGVRPSASAGGFGALRSRIVEAVEGRLAAYVEDLLEVAHDGEGEAPERARLFLDAVRPTVGFLEGEGSAEIIRRRAAAA